jgi:hypothetical protein
LKQLQHGIVIVDLLFFPEGIASFLSNFAEPGDIEYAPPVGKVETKV